MRSLSVLHKIKHLGHTEQCLALSRCVIKLAIISQEKRSKVVLACKGDKRVWALFPSEEQKTSAWEKDISIFKANFKEKKTFTFMYKYG